MSKKPAVQDRRRVFNMQRLELEDGTVIRFSGKYDGQAKRLKVYRIYGDVTKEDQINDALYSFTQALGLAPV